MRAAYSLRACRSACSSPIRRAASSTLGDRLGDTRVRVVVFRGWFRAQRLGLGACFGVGGGLWLAFGGPRLAGVDGGLVLTPR